MNVKLNRLYARYLSSKYYTTYMKSLRSINVHEHVTKQTRKILTKAIKRTQGDQVHTMRAIQDIGYNNTRKQGTSKKWYAYASRLRRFPLFLSFLLQNFLPLRVPSFDLLWADELVCRHRAADITPQRFVPPLIVATAFVLALLPLLP